ncbi:MAG TPA: response regulator [Candidatus Thermoplasmatota archaeon]|nr:response regulator [Candidatus Thermoplasmatota archaeon]
MAGPDLTTTLSFVTQALLLLTAVLTMVEYVRRGGKELRDIAMMFASLGASTVVTWLSAWPLHYKATWLTIVSGVALVAHPFLVVRIVRHFRPVPWWVDGPLLVGMVGAWAYIVWNALTNPTGGTPTTTLGLAVVLLVLAYFAYGELYGAFAFVTGARRSAGVAKRRLNFAALGAALLGGLFVVAGVGIVRPDLADLVDLAIQPLAVLFILSWYAGFSPPRWLRRGWQLQEVQRYLDDTSGRSVDERARRAMRGLKLAAMRLTGAGRASILLPGKEDWEVWMLHQDGHEDRVRVDRIPGTALSRAFDRRELIVDRVTAPERAAAVAKGVALPPAAPNMLYLPLVSENGARGVLAVPLERIPLFLDESIEILETLADQTAVALDVQSFASEQEDLRSREARYAAEELRRQNFAMQEATRLKSEFLANMSHELRTPLNGIIGFADLMASGKVGPVNPEHEEFVQDILTSARHLLQLINDVLDLAKVEAGRMEFRPETFDPKEVLEETLVVVRPLAERKGIEMRVETAPEIATVDLDPVRFKQITYNFVSNAIKFTPERGSVTIRVAAEGPDRIRLEVQDTGVGIRAEDIPKLFHEFSQLDAGMAKHHQGTGLGLALVKRLAEAQGGTVGVQSAPGKGSTFHVILPRAAPKVSDATSSEAPLVASGPRVLVIDDERADRDAIVGALRAHGYQVDTASNGREALQLIASNTYDAATIDLVLPDIHGYDLVRALRERAGGARVAVLIVTQLAKDKVHASFRVDGVFHKPVDGATLAEALQKLSVMPAPDRAVLVVDDDPTVRRLVETHLRSLGYRAITAADGFEALAAVKREQPAFIVLDLVMPNMDGFSFLDAYRRDGGAAPVLVWTSKDLTAEETALLRGQVQIIAYKAEGGSFALANQLEEALRSR